MIKIYESDSKKELSHIIEAGLTTVNMDRGMTLIANQIKKRVTSKVYILKYKQDYRNSFGNYTSIRMVIDKGAFVELRFNMKKGVNNSNLIESIDFYMTLSPYPTFTMFLQGHNILQVLDIIVEAILKPQETMKNLSEETMIETIVGKDDDFIKWLKTEFIKDEFLVNTKKLTIYSSYDSFAKSNNLATMSLPTFNNLLKSYLVSKGLVQKYDRVRIVKSTKNEKREISNELKDLMSFVDNEMKSNDLEDDLETLKTDIKMVAGNLGKNGKSLLVAFGDAGIGKSETVYSTVKSLGIPYAYTRITVKSQADFYKLLYTNNNKLIIIDDSNDILKKSSKFTMQLLALGDTSLINRRLSYVDVKDKDIKSDNNPNGKIPQSFTFGGGIIFLTNTSLTKLDNALVSRAIMSKVEASNEGIIGSIKSNIDKFYPEVDLKTKEIAVDFIEQLSNANMIKKLDFRIYAEILNYMSTPGLPVDRVKVMIIQKIKKGLFNLY